MTPGEVIGKNVQKARKEKGWSAAKLARELGVALNTVQAIEKGATQKSKFIPDIARILAKPLNEIDPSQTEHDPIPAIPKETLVGARDLPVFATTEAGEGVLVMTSEPVDKADRPASLLHVRDAYGVQVRGDSMGAVVPAGSVVVVNPHAYPRREDICVFRAQRDGEFYSTVKEFVARTAEGWKVKRYKPEEREFVLKSKDWAECHVVVTIHRR